MKLLIFLFSAVTVLPVLADPPETYIPSRYYDLWRNSPFTDPPPEEEPEEVKNDLEDWVLMGVRKYKDSQIVTVVNSKDRNQRVEIPSKDANDLGFAILEVKMARSFLNTEVHLQKGPHRGWVQYDPKFLVVKRAPGPQKNTNGKTNTKTPPRPGSTGSRPPVPGAKPTTTATSSRTGRTTAPPAPGSTGARTNSTSTKSTTTTKKPRVRYVPRPK